MDSDSKKAVRRRVKQWDALVRQGFHDTESMLSEKCVYLEDLLRIYQSALDSAAASALNSLEQSRQWSGASPSTFSLSHQQLHQQQHVEASPIVPEKSPPLHAAAGAANMSHDTIQQFKELNSLRSRCEALESQLHQSRFQPPEGHMLIRVAEFEASQQLVLELERQLLEEQRRAHDLEKDTSRNLRKAQQMMDFVNRLGEVADLAEGQLTKQVKRHRSRMQHLRSIGFGDANPAAAGEGGSAADGQGGAHPDDGTVGGSLTDLPSSSTTKGQPVERLIDALKRWESVSDRQELDWEFALRSRADVVSTSEKELHAKLTESYAHCQLLLARNEDLGAKIVEERESLQLERDRALDQRDRAVIALRAMENARDRRQAFIHTSTQTVRTEGNR